MEPTGYRAGGARRIDRVLSPGFVADLPEQEDAELRARRELATSEESDLDYTGRFVEGRLSLLRAEKARRDRHEPGARLGERSDREIAAGLAAELLGSRGGSGQDDDDAARDVVDPRDLDHLPGAAGVYQRDAEVASGDLRLSDLASVEDADLDGAAERLDSLGRRLAADRARVLAVLRALRREGATREHRPV